MNKILLSLFDHSGNTAKPFKDNNWEVHQIDIKHGKNIFDFNADRFMSEYLHRPFSYHIPEIGIIAGVPCTDYALSGAAWFKAKDADGRTDESQKLVAKTKEIIDFFEKCGCLKFWAIENPMSRIHKLNTWMGFPKLKFNPCDYALYSDEPDKDRYNKQTWIWGNFNIPEKKRLEPFQKEFPGHLKLGGKSERTKELRSITPMGFANAFYQFNN